MLRAKSTAKPICSGLLSELAGVLSRLFDKFIETIYVPRHRATLGEPPPVMRWAQSPSTSSDGSPLQTKNRPSLYDPLAAWKVLERARSIHALSARTTLLAKSDETNLLGLAGSNADRWLCTDVILYQDKHQALTSGLHFYNMTADPSVYGGIDTLIGVLWVYERKVATNYVSNIKFVYYFFIILYVVKRIKT